MKHKRSHHKKTKKTHHKKKGGWLNWFKRWRSV